MSRSKVLWEIGCCDVRCREMVSFDCVGNIHYFPTGLNVQTYDCDFPWPNHPSRSSNEIRSTISLLPSQLPKFEHLSDLLIGREVWTCHQTGTFQLRQSYININYYFLKLLVYTWPWNNCAHVSQCVAGNLSHFPPLPDNLLIVTQHCIYRGILHWLHMFFHVTLSNFSLPYPKKRLAADASLTTNTPWGRLEKICISGCLTNPAKWGLLQKHFSILLATENT